jgi:peptidoglycan/LPS O-acetylase OafA/YrhL
MSSADHGRILYLDGWRGLAILVVLVGHFIPGMEVLGGFGVDLFFVLSGRLMAQILVDERYPLPTFFMRRFSRIYPALLVFATMMLVASILVRTMGRQFNSLISLLDYFAALTMWMNYKVVFFGEAGAVDHLWSISVEEHSYIILAALAALCSRSRKVGVVAGFLAILALTNGFILDSLPGASDRVLWRTDVRIAPLFLSFAIYLAPLPIRKALGKVAPYLFFISFMVPFSGFSLAMQLAISSVLLACAVNGMDYTSSAFRKVFEGKAIRFIGVTSYSLYLWQQPFFTMHERFSVLVLLPLVFVSALASYYLVEQPSRRAINRWVASLKAKVEGDESVVVP